MLELVSRETIQVCAAVLFCVYLYAIWFGETRKLRHIPAAGHDGVLMSYWSAIQLLYHPPGYLRREWAKIPPGTKFVKVPSLNRWLVVPATPAFYKDVASAPEHLISQADFLGDILMATYTLFHDDIGDNIQVHPIRTNLSRNLGELVPLVHEEMEIVFSETFPIKDGDDEFQSFEWTSGFLRIIAAMNSRAIVGVPLCRNKEYLETIIIFAVDLVVESYALALIPPFLRSLAHRLFSPIPGRYKKIAGWLQPLADRHRARREKGCQDPAEEKILLNWLMDTADQYRKPQDDAIKRTMSVNFGSIHTTSVIFTHALYSLLSRPRYIEALRTEIDQCIQSLGWTKEAVDSMRIVDSFLKESMRFDTFSSVGTAGGRIVVQDTSLYGVPLPAGTMITANVIDAHFHPDAFGPSAHEFDPYRFIKLEEETGRKIAVVTTGVDAMTFGHGRHACPGRFFATQAMKLVMAYLLHRYDLELDNADGKRPRNMWVGLTCVPDRKARILLRRRVAIQSPC